MTEPLDATYELIDAHNERKARQKAAGASVISDHNESLRALLCTNIHECVDLLASFMGNHPEQVDVKPSVLKWKLAESSINLQDADQEVSLWIILPRDGVPYLSVMGHLPGTDRLDLDRTDPQKVLEALHVQLRLG